MDIRKTLITLGILIFAFAVLLTGYLLFGRKEKEDASKKPTLAEAFNFPRESVTKIALSNGVVLEKFGEDWKLTAPIKAPADKDKAESLLRILNQSLRKRMQGNLADFGLATPQASVAFTGGSGTKTFLLGNKGVSYSLYAKEKDEPGILVIESSTLDDVNKDASDLRDRHVLRFKPEDVLRISVVPKSGKPLVAERPKPEDEWRLLSPTKTKANRESMDSILYTLSGLEAKTFPDAAPPSAMFVSEVSLKFANGTQKSLRIGESNSGCESLVVVGNAVYGVPADSLKAIPQSPAAWRDMRLADFQRTETQRVEIATAKGKVVLEKQEKEGMETWRITAPKPQDADQTKVDDFLWDIDSMKAKEILSESGADAAKYGLDKPEITMTFYDRPQGGKGATIRFGKKLGANRAVQSSRFTAIGLAPDDTVSKWATGVAAFEKK